MGRKSKELQAIEKRAEEKAWPVLNVDYHVMRVAYGKKPQPGFLGSGYSSKVAAITQATTLLTKYKAGELKLGEDKSKPWYGVATWAVYPGMRPKKTWGPVCP